MDSVLVASAELPELESLDVPVLQRLRSEPPGYECNGSRVYVSNATPYLQEMRSDAAGTAALAAGLALLPGGGSVLFREVLHSGGTEAMRRLLSEVPRPEAAVVWDTSDRPWRLNEFLARL